MGRCGLRSRSTGRAPVETVEEDPVFAAFCTTCSRRELIAPGQVLGAHNDEQGIHVSFRCSRGHVGELLTGRRRTPAA